jgi:multiple antibiotic resistance protein
MATQKGSGRRGVTQKSTRVEAAAVGGLIVLAATAVVYAQGAATAPAAAGEGAFSLGKQFTFLFLTLGPLKVIAPFATMTRGQDARFKRRLALEGTLIAALATITSATIGSRILNNWGVSVDSLRITAGIVLFLVALRPVMEQYAPQEAETPAPLPGPALKTSSLAYSPLAFPTIVTPYGVAVLVMMVTLAGGDPAKILRILGLVGLVLALDLAAMLAADRVLRTPLVKPVLGTVGSVMSVLQVALGVQAVVGALQHLGAFG